MNRSALESERLLEPPSELASARIRKTTDEAQAAVALVDLAVAFAPEAGGRALARATLDTLHTLFPDCAVGVCLVPRNGASTLVEARLPPGLPQPISSPTRMFADLEAELTFGVDGSPGSTLHLGRPRGLLVAETLEARTAERAAALLGRALRTSDALSLAKPASATVEELRSQIVQAEKLATLGQIVAGVVHELANPLTSIVASTDFLLKKGPDSRPPEDQEQLRRIGLSANRLLKFSRDLVAYARPANEQPVPLALPDVVGQAYAFSEHELERRGISFSADYAGGAPPVVGQSGPLTQVFINLFTNAAHAMNDHGGNLTVRTQVAHADKRLLILVTDTGIGIPRETIGRIFEPFFTTKEKGRGTGLGLSIVREILEAHGGSVEAASTPGEGTTFTVDLPLHVWKE